ncbi:MAG: hypothetical protein IPM82_09855 [Saprospiraceae bacterium]|nr:hypothetical protein [Saprospiraceae bacterium]
MNFFTGTLTTLSFLVLCATVALNGAVAVFFLLRKNENKRADLAFFGLLLAYALTALHHIFILQGIYQANPHLTSLPLYFTLSFGVLLYISVKLRLFPTYKFVGSDAKHAVLPFGQFAYFLGALLLTDGLLIRRFYSPFMVGWKWRCTFSPLHLPVCGVPLYPVQGFRRSAKNRRVASSSTRHWCCGACYESCCCCSG